MTGLPSRARLLAITVVVSNLAGNAFLSLGMKGTKGIAAFLSAPVLVGIALLVFWTISRASLLSWADLSYVLPVTASGYVLTAVVGALFLNEQVSAVRWMATLLIVAGIILASATPARTRRQEPE